MIALVHSIYFNNVYLFLKTCLLSVNIWSHFLGLILFVVIGLFSWFVFLAPLRPILGPGDIAVFYVFILGAMVCLGMSSSFHCFIAHSEKVRIKSGQNRLFFSNLVGGGARTRITGLFHWVEETLGIIPQLYGH